MAKLISGVATADTHRPSTVLLPLGLSSRSREDSVSEQQRTGKKTCCRFLAIPIPFAVIIAEVQLTLNNVGVGVLTPLVVVNQV